MATYFDITSYADINLLHGDVRNHCELSNVAAQVESDVINRFRERNRGAGYPYPYFASSVGTPYSTTDGKYIIWLDGYKEDADEADTRLKDALRRTIADVISHRLRYYEEENGVKRFSQGRVSIEYSGSGRDAEWPRQWSRRLTEFDLNPCYV